MNEFSHIKDAAELDKLLKYRTSLLNAANAITEGARPQQFKLLLENMANVRNILIVCGALASFGLAAISNRDLDLGAGIKFMFELAEIFFLLATLAYAFYLKINLGQGILVFRKFREDGTESINKQLKLVNSRLNGEISNDDFTEQKRSALLEMEKVHLRSLPEKKENDETPPEKWLGDSGNFFLVAGVVLLIIALLWLAIIG